MNMRSAGTNQLHRALTKEANVNWTKELQRHMRIPYALRRVPEQDLGSLLSVPHAPKPGDLALAEVERIGKNTTLELANGRRSTLHLGDLIAIVFGNRYATKQFDGYAGIDGDRCELLSQGGLSGLVRSKHSSMPDATRLKVLGAFGDAHGRTLSLRNYAVAPRMELAKPRVVVVCGTSMDAGKTYTAMSLIVGLRKSGHRVAGIKLTGTAAGNDRWMMQDAGACVALDFGDGGYESTYYWPLDELLALYDLLLGHAAAMGAEFAVVECADGMIQAQTAQILQSPRFRSTVDAFVVATSDAVGAIGAVQVVQGWGIEPLAISGVVSMSTLGVKETEANTGLPCLTAQQLQAGELNSRIIVKKSA
jgi:hypothetical protein